MSGAEVKVPFWERKLLQYVGSLESEPFAWGQLDCAIFAHQCLVVQFGDSKIPDFRGKYKTAKGAMSALKKQFGCSSLEEAVSIYLEEINPKLARRGDIVSVKINNASIEGIGCSLGVCLGARYAVLTIQGVAYIESDKIDRAWRAAR